jgi:hypothetical protein
MIDLYDALSRTTLLVQGDLFPSLSNVQIVDHLAGRRVRLCADARNLAEPAGQAAVVSAAISIAQTGARLALELADIPVCGAQPPLAAEGSLPDALRAWGADLLQPMDLGPGEPVDLTVVFGDTATSAKPAIRVVGGAWEARIGDAAAPGSPWAGELPFGAMLSGPAVAAEAFRMAMDSLGATHGVRALPEHHVGAPGEVRLALEPLGVPAALALGALDFISAGAITNAAVAAMLRVPGMAGALRVFDADTGALSNLNRYALLNVLLLDQPKVHALARFQSRLLSIEPLAVRLGPQSGPTTLAERVLVGVDDIPSRWLAQKRSPGWLCVAGTSRMEVVVSEHVRGGACAGCMHAHDDDGQALIPTASFVSQLAGVLQAYRLLANAIDGTTRPPLVAYGLGLNGPRPLLSLGQRAREDCPVACVASRALQR